MSTTRMIVDQGSHGQLAKHPDFTQIPPARDFECKRLVATTIPATLVGFKLVVPREISQENWVGDHGICVAYFCP